MAEHHLDHPGEWHWFSGYGPLPVLGDCPHVTCPHNQTGTVAYGPDFGRYALIQCCVPDGCNRECRGWLAVEPDGYAEYFDQIEWKQVALGVPQAEKPQP